MHGRIVRAARAGKRALLQGCLLLSRLLPVEIVRSIGGKLAAMAKPELGGPRQLLADVSVISRLDAGSGIQRVVKQLLLQLIVNPPPGYEVRPIQTGRWREFRYAEDYRIALGGASRGAGPTGRVRVQAGDIFLGMDLAAETLPRQHFLLGRWKASGVKFFFIVYDLLPVLRPEWFVARSVREYRRWIRTVAMFADCALCISNSVSHELRAWSAQQYGLAVARSLHVAWFHLGSDFPSTGSAAAMPKETEGLISRLNQRRSILMVGTIEPRKGHMQAVLAFEQLWAAGRDVNLVIVGNAGWKVEAVLKKLRSHNEKDRRLIWLKTVPDQLLNALYSSVDGLLVASEGEGFGLPIIEASRHSTPVLARDLPVFREIARCGALYFSGTTSEVLSAALFEWLDLIETGRAPRPEEITQQTWHESSRQLVSHISGNQRSA